MFNLSMVASNERGRALEWAVRAEVAKFAERKGLAVEVTARTKERDAIEGAYFAELDAGCQQDFTSCAITFTVWLQQQHWLDDASKLVLDRIPDNETQMTDIRLSIYKGSEVQTKNLSVKSHHNALCHPRLPSLPGQCKIDNPRIDASYRENYKRIWNKFYSKVKALGKRVNTYAALEKKNEKYRYDWLYVPLQKSAVKFLRENANNPENAKAFFKYLVGNNDYYVIKNGTGKIEVKQFVGISPPSSFKITYPWNGKKTTFLIEFDNGWKITLRLHTASSRIVKSNGMVFMTEKEDPICINLESLIAIDTVMKE